MGVLDIDANSYATKSGANAISMDKQTVCVQISSSTTINEGPTYASLTLRMMITNTASPHLSCIDKIFLRLFQHT